MSFGRSSRALFSFLLALFAVCGGMPGAAGRQVASVSPVDRRLSVASPPGGASQAPCAPGFTSCGASSLPGRPPSVSSWRLGIRARFVSAPSIHVRPNVGPRCSVLAFASCLRPAPAFPRKRSLEILSAAVLLRYRAPWAPPGAREQDLQTVCRATPLEASRFGFRFPSRFPMAFLCPPPSQPVAGHAPLWNVCGAPAPGGVDARQAARASRGALPSPPSGWLLQYRPCRSRASQYLGPRFLPSPRSRLPVFAPALAILRASRRPVSDSLLPVSSSPLPRVGLSQFPFPEGRRCSSAPPQGPALFSPFPCPRKKNARPARTSCPRPRLRGPPFYIY